MSHVQMVANRIGWPMRAASGDRGPLARYVIALLGGALCLVSLFSMAWGASDASLFAVLGDWFMSETDSRLSVHERIIIYEIRLPRTILGILTGAGLAIAGAVLQGLFRNPLADPGIIGVSAGAAVGAVSVIVWGGTVLAPLTYFLGLFALPVAAFAGALTATMVLYGIATRHGRTSVATMLLAGIALGALAAAFTGLMIFMADDRQLRDVTFWSLGSLAGATWSKIGTAGSIILTSLATMPFLARGLNGFALGESTAGHLGLPVQRVKYTAIITATAATGAAVAVSGGIAFVGIVVPHMLRLLIGPDHRYLLPASALLGAIMLLLADAVSRTIVAPAELPIGIVTAAVGAPFFLWILLRKRGIVDL